MALHALIKFGSAYVKYLRRAPALFKEIPKLSRVFVNLPIRTPRLPLPSRFLRIFNPSDSIVHVIHKSVTSSSAHRRPNTLLRAYSGIAGSVKLRHQLAFSPKLSLLGIDDPSEKPKSSWFSNLFSSFTRYRKLPNLLNSSESLVPRELIGVGCNSAVWAADVHQSVDSDYPEPIDDDGKSQLAVKVLYNYYASSDSVEETMLSSSINPSINDVSGNAQLMPEQLPNGLLLERQLQREAELRPPEGHPNIVPIIGHFVDRAPTAPGVHINGDSSYPNSMTTDTVIVSPSNSAPSTNQAQRQPHWEGADAFPEGFGGRPFTHYLLMPRFDATLDQFLTGAWSPTVGAIRFEQTAIESVYGCDLISESSPSVEPIAVTSNRVSSPCPSANPLNVSRCLLETAQAISVLAQLFDAVAELERIGVAHRDIKPNNIVIRQRRHPHQFLQSSQTLASSGSTKLPSGISWLSAADEVEWSNSSLHVALTDFGCATRISNTSSVHHRIQSYLGMVHPLHHLIGHLFSSQPGIHANAPDPFSHSGNIALLAPEIASQILTDRKTTDSHTVGLLDYSRSDIWAMATMAYPIFGLPNPFIDGTLSSMDYSEDQLPNLPDHTPGVVNWLVQHCLKRDPTARPPADFVADVLHTWCLLQHTRRRHQQWHDTFRTTTPGYSLPQNPMNSVLSETLTLALVSIHEGSELSASVLYELRTILNIFWAADWLTGAARAPDGLRIWFYRRITLGRLANCLRIVMREEGSRTYRISGSLVQAAKLLL